MPSDYNSVQWVMSQSRYYPLLEAHEEITICRTIQEGVHLIYVPDSDVIIHSPPVKNEPSARNGVSLENGSIR